MAALQAIKQFRIRELGSLLKTTPVATNALPKVTNPFLPFKNPESGRWAPPKYSLRRQAELIKHARASNTLHLLPPGPKLRSKELQSAFAAAAKDLAQEWWTGKVQWEGELKEKVVPGAEFGNRLYAGKKVMFKGHKWERTMAERMKKRKLLMKGMEARIERFKSVRTSDLAARVDVVLTCCYNTDLQEENSEPSQCTAECIIFETAILVSMGAYTTSYFRFPFMLSIICV
ncbi:54S ribosomal protein L25, mitochondrial [Grifola frondosa]|uniref:54S ribosomal protein L25, mitochondrial n=1 Tax=Grifola frondosa TaxID=5627 RepID=A0A1C7LTG4_GRIFR|nr:54S ribosomal protein L25, mitochondrial [Grifola frondosa]